MFLQTEETVLPLVKPHCLLGKRREIWPVKKTLQTLYELTS